MKYAFRGLLLVVLVFSLPAFAQEQRSNTNDSDKQDYSGKLESSSKKQSEHSKTVKRLNDAALDLKRLTDAGDNGIPNTILADAKCVAIVPTLVKAGFVFGAEHGRGVATCRTEKGWSTPAFFTLTGGSWGAQIGVSSVDLVMLFMTREGAEKLLTANWKIGADAGIAAGPFGRDASANTTWKMNTGILTYSRAKGVFIGATLNGANVAADESSISAFYGRAYNFRELLEGKVTPPAAARPFLTQIRTDFHEANATK